ncbi:MAG TPA: molybdopterin-dependent oxidoreductase [Candidatus Polarisedimenticolia bacterium]|jgi:anaerobic selenocysteine-containing dehydrogenase|nr:molybdopterin-dependent oxidoreductase [Candidatus Polarisedimenticolia bacterium]
MSAHHSVCPLDCPDRCSLEVTLENGRVAAITGSRVNPLTDGFICAKVRDFPQRVYGKDRLLYPMRRVGAKGEGRFERVSWDEATAAIASTFKAILKEHGGEAILPFFYGGSNGLLTQGMSDERLFRSIGASRLARTVCAAPTAAASDALYGKMASVDFTDFAKSRFIIIWGANPKHSNIHLMPYLKAAREAGGRVALIDPRLTMSGQYVDLHLPVFPGTDGAVALAMIGHLERIGAVDRTFLERHTTGWEKLLERARAWTLERAASVARVEARDIATIAEAYAAADPALIRCGWGLERNRNGEPAVAAVLALPAIAGKFGRPGGGYALTSSPAYQVDDDRLAGVPEAKTRIINMNRLGRVLLEETRPPVKALFVYNCNPLVTVPDQNRIRQGLLRDDLFTVVFDQVTTDTALYADILLPATTFLEHTELSTSYGTYGVMLGDPLIEPVGEARPNEEVFGLILDRLGVDGRRPVGDALLREALAAIGGPLRETGGPLKTQAGGSDGEPAAATGAERLAALRRDRFLPFDFPGPLPIQFKTAFPRTPGRKADLWPAALGEDPYVVRDDPGSERYPLALISPATDKTISSTLGEFNHRDVRLEMHPQDAAARRLADGQAVRAHNPLGEVRVRLRINPDVRPGVVFLPKGIWNRHTLNGRVGTALVPDDVSAVSGGACFNDARIEVGPA